MESTHRRMVTLLEQGDYAAILEEHIELDRRLHRRFVEFTCNRRLVAVYGQIDTNLQVARVQSQFRLEDSLETRREHENLMAAIRLRDVVATRQALADHIDASKRWMIKVLDHA